MLPVKDDIPEGHVPVSRNDYRLDPYLPPISAETVRRLMARISQRRVCNNLHLQGSCSAGDRCVYDHGPLDPKLLPALESLARSQPCQRREACRLVSCSNGHICQIPDCRHRGGKVFCKIPHQAHLEEYEGARFVPGVARLGSKPGNGSPRSSASKQQLQKACF